MLFPRSDYAKALADQLLSPSGLHTGVRSGVFLSNIRRVGKSTFLRNELVPELRQRGAIVIYVDLWADVNRAPLDLVLEAVRKELRALQTPGADMLKRLKGMGLGAAGLSLSFQLDTLGRQGGATLAQAMRELVHQARADVVLIVDEVQQAAGAAGNALMAALKAARDEVNGDPQAPGHFLFVGTGSHRSLMNDMATKPSHPFKGAVTATFEPLPQAYVQWKLNQLAADGVRLPSPEAAWRGFQTLGHRPEELERALGQFQAAPQGSDAEFDLICATLASTAADIEFARAGEIGGELGELVFTRIADGPEDGTRELYGQAALADYAAALGMAVEVKQVQNAVDALVAANLIARIGHGRFIISDPYVRSIWRQRNALTQALRAGQPMPVQRGGL
ncbi:ATPase [Vandammella animalimorsus]|uniref:ATPase n=1 Tax=Vandammella animalimorsus TaxID=2029117 RepID=A0A2A2AG83_9BURK|nr:ATPase [Vandammella animalimorsus]PAT37565.1 ATPase [Vandammella animalimorsus]